jgi:hypothetical protein
LSRWIPRHPQRWALLTTALAIGCGGQDENGDLGIGRGIAGGLTLAELTTEDANRLCDDAVQALRAEVDLDRLTCTGVGLLGAALVGGDAAVCEGLVTECLSEPPPATDETQWVYGCDFADPERREGCDVTVAEAAVCLEQTIEVLAGAISCDLLDAEEANGVDPYPDSCADLAARCPGVFEGDDL